MAAGPASPDLPFNPWTRPALESYQTICAAAADGIRQAEALGEAERWRFDWDRPYTRDDYLDQVPTAGGHNQLPRQQLKALLAGLGAAIDSVCGSFTVQYAALVVTAARRDDA